MELSPVRSSFGTSVYKTDNGMLIKMKKGTGNVQVNDNGVVVVNGGEKVRIAGTRGDDKLVVKDAHVSFVSTDSGKDRVLLDNCSYDRYSHFWGTGSRIQTGPTMFRRGNKGDYADIMIRGDFNGGILAQQGAGKGYGDDSKAHKDYIRITGDNNGHINVDSHDKVKVKGEKGHIFNTTIYYC